jgi:outer membrane protein assembly factor BamB
MRKTSRRRRIGAGVIFLVLAMGSPMAVNAASLWSKMKRVVSNQEEELDSSSVNQLIYKEVLSDRQNVVLNPKWAVNVGEKLNTLCWIGTTYKDIPYSEQEFYEIRVKKIEAEVTRKREEHIGKKKAEEAKSGAVVSELLDDLLGGSEKKDKDDSKYLEGFDEDEVRRTVSKRLFVAQSRAVVIPALFVQSTTGALYCFELETGLTSWVNNLGIALTAKPYENEKFIYVASGASITVIDKRSGFTTEKLNFDRAVYPVVFANDSHVYAASYDDRILCYKWGESYAEWTQKLPGSVAHGLFGYENGLLAPLNNGELLSFTFDGHEKWRFVSKSHSDEKIYLEGLRNEHVKQIEKEKADARRDGRPEDASILFKISKEIEGINKQLRDLSHRVKGRYIAMPAMSGQELVVGSTDFKLYRMNVYSSASAWSYTCVAENRSSALIRGNWVWQLDELGNVHRVDYKTGQGKIVLKGVQSILDAQNDGVMVLSSGKLRVWSERTEAEMLGRPAGHKVLASLSTGVMVSCDTAQGQILAFPTTELRPLQ